MAAAPTPRPFTVHVADDVLAELRSRLERARFPDEVPGSGWKYGSDLAYGVGAQFRVLGLSIRAEYEKFEISEVDLDMISVGLTYTFL